MARINLLPWREARRERLKQEFFGNLGSAAIAAALCVGAIYFLVGSAVDGQLDRNGYLQTYIDKLNKDVEEIASLKANREQLIDRMNIIQSLQGNRPAIVRIFDQFVETLPDGVYYTHLKRDNSRIEIEGAAESNNRVSSLMRRIDGSDWFLDPNLTSVVSNPEFGEQANSFSLVVSLATLEQQGEEG